MLALAGTSVRQRTVDGARQWLAGPAHLLALTTANDVPARRVRRADRRVIPSDGLRAESLFVRVDLVSGVHRRAAAAFQAVVHHAQLAQPPAQVEGHLRALSVGVDLRHDFLFDEPPGALEAVPFVRGQLGYKREVVAGERLPRCRCRQAGEVAGLVVVIVFSPFLQGVSAAGRTRRQVNTYAQAAQGRCRCGQPSLPIVVLVT